MNECHSRINLVSRLTVSFGFCLVKVELKVDISPVSFEVRNLNTRSENT